MTDGDLGSAKQHSWKSDFTSKFMLKMFSVLLGVGNRNRILNTRTGLFCTVFQRCLIETVQSRNANSYYETFNPITIVLENCETLTILRIWNCFSVQDSQYKRKLVSEKMGKNSCF